MTGQKKKHSLLESFINIGIGFGISFTANIIVLPFFGFNVHPVDAFNIGIIFTIISIIRSYCVRRLFNYLHTTGVL